MKKKIWITIGIAAIIAIAVEAFCYFYAANNVEKENNELQPGTVIMIPEAPDNSAKTEAN